MLIKEFRGEQGRRKATNHPLANFPGMGESLPKDLDRAREFWKIGDHIPYYGKGFSMLSRDTLFSEQMALNYIEMNEKNGWGYTPKTADSEGDRLVSLADSWGIFIFRFEPVIKAGPIPDCRSINLKGGNIGGIVLAYTGNSSLYDAALTRNVQDELYGLIETHADALNSLPDYIKQCMKMSAEYQKEHFLADPADMSKPEREFSVTQMIDSSASTNFQIYSTQRILGLPPAIKMYDGGRRLVEIVEKI